ncbi:MAG: SDR family NAD(P)-dependent oxidoreductase, partial [Myxococcota bacterium]
MNEQHSPLTWFITGVSRGLGRALAERALERGDTVVGTIRQASQRAAFEALAPGRALAYELDVTDGAAIDDVVARAVGAVGHVDVVVNNAGYGQIGTLEASSEAEARHQFEVNVFGALRVTQAFLPH